MLLCSGLMFEQATVGVTSGRALQHGKETKKKSPVGSPAGLFA